MLLADEADDKELLAIMVLSYVDNAVTGNEDEVFAITILFVEDPLEIDTPITEIRLLKVFVVPVNAFDAAKLGYDNNVVASVEFVT